jgi:hypothetical protein
MNSAINNKVSNIKENENLLLKEKDEKLILLEKQLLFEKEKLKLKEKEFSISFLSQLFCIGFPLSFFVLL